MSILLCFTLFQCSNNSTSERPEYIRILDDIPQDIQEVKNLTILPGDAKPTHSIELIPEQTFGKSGEPYLTQVLECAIDDKGKVIITNGRKNSNEFPFLYRVYAYNADGSYHTQIGATGKGPGEYGMILGVQAVAGKVFVLDYTSQRLNIYNTDDYSFERSILIERLNIRDHEAVQDLEFGYFKVRSDGNFLIMFKEPNSGTDRPVYTYLLMDVHGNALDFAPLVFPSNLNAMKSNSRVPNAFRPLPFMGETITALSDENAIYSVWTQDFLIKKYDARGNYQSAIYYPVTGSSFDLSEYTEQSSYTRGDVMNTLEIVDEKLPESNPAIADMKIDDENRIWVAVPTGVQSEIYEWWILKESGELLAKLRLARDQPIYDIKNGYLYSKKTNKETGTEYAVKYRIELAKNN
ncbi:6-bladed beta-propeller [Fodinibius halophilus]|uniref:6-bladed beta-propeller n=1 Tax=Fodinibius halophilus TaxID=1736908 RepID=UPI00197A9FE7|nr:6-bladed beta-propeller [Fodinibius halophilus]